MAKQGLRKTWNLKAKLVFNFGGAQKRMGEGDEKRKRKKKRRRKRRDQVQKGMELLTLSMDPWFCLVNGYLLYPNLGFVRISS